MIPKQERLNQVNFKKVLGQIRHVQRNCYAGSKLFTHNLSRSKQRLLDQLRLAEAMKEQEKIKKLVQEEVIEPVPDYPQEMMSEERKIKENYVFLKKCVQDAHIVPIDQFLIQGIKKRIFQNCSVFSNQLLDELFEEISDMYIKSIRDALVKQSLRLPSIPGISTHQPQSSYFRNETFYYLSPESREFYSNSAKYIAENLFSVHPILRVVLNICNEHFHDVCLVDFDTMLLSDAMELNSVKNNAILNCDNAEDILMQKWYPSIINLFVTLKSFKKMSRHKQRSIFSCVNTLVGIKVRSLLNKSLDQIGAIFDIKKHEKAISCGINYVGDSYYGSNILPQIKVDLMIENDTILFYPSAEDITDVYHEVVDIICSTMQNVPQIKSWLSGSSSPLTIKASISSTTINQLKNDISLSIRHYFKLAEKYLNIYKDTFKSLVNGEEENVVNSFLMKKRSFDEYRDIISRLKRKKKDIEGFQSVYYFCMIRLDVVYLHESLLLKVRNLQNVVFKSMQQYHEIKCKEIIGDFENFRDRSLSKPENTFQLIDLGKFVADMRLKKMNRIRKDISKSVERMRFLLTEHVLPESQLQLNATLLNWPGKVNEILDQNDDIMKCAQEAGEQLLAERKEKILLEMSKLMQRCGEFVDMGDISMCGQYLNDVRYVQKRIFELSQEADQINVEENLYKQTVTQFTDFEKMTSMTEPYYKLFSLVFRWQRSDKKWNDGSFADLSADTIRVEVEDFQADCFKSQQVFQKEYRRRKAEVEELKREANRAKRRKSVMDVQAPVIDVSPPAALTICDKIYESISQFKTKINVIEVMCNPGIRQRHWDRMTQVAGVNMTPDSGTTLKKILKMNLDEFMDEFEQISTAASKEYALERALDKMTTEWENVSFNLSQYRETEVSILSSVDDIQLLLEDQIVKTQTMRGSPFIKPVYAEIMEWESKLIRIDNTLDEWLKVQSQWLYLEPIFCSADIMAQMPEEGRLFKNVDRTWKDVMKNVSEDAKVLNAACLPNLLERLQDSNALLERINKGLNLYLENKRLYFSRFFFLSNDEMLEILSETKDPKRVQPHLKKCFEGINTLDFDNELNITHMNSSEGEKIKLSAIVSTSAARGLVEKWLLQVQDSMLLSIHDVIEKARMAYGENYRGDWVKEWPGQVVLCVSSIYWSIEVESVLSDGGGKRAILKYANQLETQLATIVILVQSKLSKQQRITFGALVVIDVHARDVVYDLAEKDTTSPLDFNWLSQLRYYWLEEKCVVKIVNAEMNYGCEYLGNSARLVITPLTDRCYRTLMGAYQLNLNGAPEGPAGTGKTETTKDLAKAMGVHCVVFNCSDGLDYIAMGKFFKGLASSGAWACFDEFNRIDLEVLSVVAQQILYIIRAIQADLKTFIFEGTELALNKNCYVAITMNPGYAGRSELPDNLKALFRTVAMMVPDYIMIGQIMLYSFGFMDARNLSVKIVTTYRLCSEQLSTQPHYDYGMRAVKAVLSAAGNLKLQFPNEKEDMLILRSLKDVNVPKFLSHDIPLFNGIISDLFPGVKLKEANYEIFQAVLEVVCKETNLQNVPFMKEKLIQLYDMMLVRHGFMMVGEPYSAKSTLLKTMAAILNRMNSDSNERGEEATEAGVVYQIVNPKAIQLGQLYGQFDPVSHEWSDGIVSNMFRDYASSTSKDRRWIILDGPVDAVWIESMNTVLDDNKKLCLVSGEVIQMAPEMSIIFETLDLIHASPATVSRCGMIYLEPFTLGWRPLFNSWLNTWPSDFKEENTMLLVMLFEWLVDPCLTFIRRQCTHYMDCGQIHMVNSLMKMVSMLMKERIEDSEGGQRNFKFYLQAAVYFGLAWSLGGLLTPNSRLKFDKFLRDLHENKNEKHAVPKDMGGVSDVALPEAGVIYDYYYDQKARGKWRLWYDEIKNIHTPPTDNIQSLMIPTIDTARYSYLMDLFIYSQQPMLFVGPTGTGKSIYVQKKLLQDLSKDKYVPMFINFSAQTSANQFQMLLSSKIDKRKKGVYGPHVGKKAMFFIDDVNMPTPEKYDAQPALELYRQILDQKYMFDLKDTSKMNLVDILFISAMNPPDGSKPSVSPRLLHHFNVVSIEAFSDASMTKIFTTMYTCYFKAMEMPLEYQKMGLDVVSATMDIYKKSITQLLPTPDKTHYVFNLRDFSRIISGVCLCKKDQIVTKKHLIRLWIHETLRVFYDRLLDQDDRKWIIDEIKAVTHSKFNETFENLFSHLVQEERAGQKITENEIRSLMWGDFMEPDVEREDRVYQEITSLTAFEAVVLRMLNEYNNNVKTPMNLVIFRYVLEHLSRISRIIRLPGGHALLVGMGGSGRQSLTRLAAFMVNMNVFQPEISKNYGVQEWHDDLKKTLIQAGGHSQPTIFLLSDTQLKYESFLEDLDSLLNSGEVPNLFEPEERNEIVELVRPLAQSTLQSTGENTEDSKDEELSPLAIFSFFINQSRKYLHIVMTFSPIGSAFRTRLRKFPSLINCCTIDWFQPWPEDALLKISDSFLSKCNISIEEKQLSTDMCTLFHSSIETESVNFLLQTGRHNYVTPTSYLVLIELFTRLFEFRQTATSEARKRYVVGLEKLAFAAQQIGQMQIELEALQPQLVVSAEENVKMMAVIEKESLEVDETKMRVAEEEKTVSAKAAASKLLKEECENDLAEAIPALNNALAALNTLKPSDITIVKSMKNPPSMIKLVMAAVCVMRDIKPEKINDPSGSGQKILDFWVPSKKLLGDMNFLRDLKEYDRDNIPIHVMAKIRKEYITHPDFDPSKVAQASSAAEGLCRWVRAMEIYDRVVKIVEPKKKALAGAEQELSETMAVLKMKQDELNQIIERLENLNKSFVEKKAQKASLEQQVQLCAMKLERAEQLISGLGGEKERWILASERLKIDYDNVLGDILLSSGMIAYLGPFTPQFRDNLLEKWTNEMVSKSIACSEPFSLSSTLGDPVTIQQWNMFGLPKDTFSIDNAVMVSLSKRWPLLIDPQVQANIWIKSFERANKICVIKFTDSDYMRTLENAITFGKPVLLENVDETLDASLEPLLLRNTFKQGGITMIKLGELIIEYSADFRFYVTTKLRNPHYLPDVATKVALINFMITPEGLEDQLLGIVVAKEKPDLEEEREALIVSSALNNKQQKEIEDKILETLFSSQGNILEDESAITVLNRSKVLSNEISKKQLVALETEKKIEDTRQGYQPVAKLSSVLYFSISDLPNIEAMYQYSLNWFINLYISSINDSNKSKILERRLRYFTDYFTYNLYCNICRSLFQQDKLLFSFILCTNLFVSRGELDPKELHYLLAGSVAIKNDLPNPASSWLPHKVWDDVCYLSQLSSFEGFYDSFMHNLTGWKEYYQDRAPQELKIPGEWNDKLNKFQQLMVLRFMRFDKVIPAIIQYVSDKLGHQFVEPPPFDLNKSFSDSKCTSPLIFILSPGADPTMVLLSFAEEKGFTGNKFQSISLGQGQGDIAAKLIANSQVEGQWVLLQNCHLALSFMERLEKICEALSTENCHPDFRLWLTSYPTDKFPVTILQNSVKITNEPPAGVKLNILQSFSADPISNEAFFNSLGSKNENFHRLLYGVCFFHAIVQERRKFGAIGWNIPYGFNESDLTISIRQLQIFIDDYEHVPFEAIKYLIGECNYGGRVTDDWDRRLLTTILDVFCTQGIVSQEKYSFSSISKEFQVPVDADYAQYLECIKNLSSIMTPHIFGMHENADITKDMGNSRVLLDSVLNVRGNQTVSGNDGVSLIESIASEIIKKLPDNFDIERAQMKYPVSYKESMNTVLVQEMSRFNDLLTVIRKSLNDLLKALKGLVLMNTDLEHMCQSLNIGKIPELWMRKSYPSLKNLASYITDLLHRLSSITEWYENGKPKVFWVSGFFFTQAFLTGALQNYARKTVIPIDTLTYDFHILDYSDSKEVQIPPKDGVYVTGLYLDGARWDKKKRVLAEQNMRILYEPLPILWIVPIKKIDLKIKDRYNCPLYKTSERRGVLLTTGHSTNFVLSILLESEISVSHWIRRGTALLCQLDD